MDCSGRIQCYASREVSLGEEAYKNFKKFDIWATSWACTASCSAPRPTSLALAWPRSDAAHQILPLPARKAQGPHQRRNPLPPALRGPHHQTRGCRPEHFSASAARSSARSAPSLKNAASWKWKRPCSIPLAGGAAARPLSSPTTTRWTWNCTCASRPSSTSSACWCGGFEKVFELQPQLPQRRHFRAPQPGIHHV